MHIRYRPSRSQQSWYSLVDWWKNSYFTGMHRRVLDCILLAVFFFFGGFDDRLLGFLRSCCESVFRNLPVRGKPICSAALRVLIILSRVCRLEYCLVNLSIQIRWYIFKKFPRSRPPTFRHLRIQPILDSYFGLAQFSKPCGQFCCPVVHTCFTFQSRRLNTFYVWVITH